MPCLASSAVAAVPRPATLRQLSGRACQFVGGCLGQIRRARHVEAGFSDTRIETLPLKPPVVCVLATDAAS